MISVCQLGVNHFRSEGLKGQQRSVNELAPYRNVFVQMKNIAIMLKC